MITLNLLPPQNKRELEALNMKKMAISFMSWVLVFLIIFSFALATIFLYISIILNSQSQSIENKRIDSKMRELSEIESLISSANEKVLQVRARQKEYANRAIIVEEIYNLVSGDIYLTNLSYQAGINQISLSGQAETRDGLLAFQESLEKSGFFDEVESPLSNLLKQNNVSFSFTMKPADIFLNEIKKF